jgi:hypothetical protein
MGLLVIPNLHYDFPEVVTQTCAWPRILFVEVVM